jgi:dihydroorotate dehydrogenase (fumarate)
MDLSTTYMGLKLKNPIVVSSSKLTDNIENVRKFAELGAGAVVLKSIFEEQFLADLGRLIDQDEKYFWFPEAVDYINTHSREQGVDEYVKLIQAAKKETDIPIIASINCVTPAEWPGCLDKLEAAGIDGLELNISIMPPGAGASSREIEESYIEIVKAVKKFVKVPLAVKISPRFTNLISMVKQFEKAGADAIVMFNRYFRPDIDIDREIVVPNVLLSCPEEMTQSLRWVSLLAQEVDCDLVGNTGIHTVEGVIKQLLAGAAAVQICSTLYKNGYDYIETMVSELEAWLQKHNYASVSQFQGKLGRYEKNIAAFERIQFMKRTLADS